MLPGLVLLSSVARTTPVSNKFSFSSPQQPITACHSRSHWGWVWIIKLWTWFSLIWSLYIFSSNSGIPIKWACSLSPRKSTICLRKLVNWSAPYHLLWFLIGFSLWHSCFGHKMLPYHAWQNCQQTWQNLSHSVFSSWRDSFPPLSAMFPKCFGEDCGRPHQTVGVNRRFPVWLHPRQRHYRRNLCCQAAAREVSSCQQETVHGFHRPGEGV